MHSIVLGALGSRHYAAPEVTTGIKRITDALNLSGSSHRKNPKRKSLADCVSTYGMVADAFSVGAVIRYSVTGVPPSMDVEEFIASKNHPLKKLLKRAKKTVSKSNDKRAKKYRLSDDLPKELNDLICILTRWDSRRRATVRSVTSHPWIKASATSSTTKDKREKTEQGGPIVFLDCQ